MHNSCSVDEVACILGARVTSHSKTPASHKFTAMIHGNCFNVVGVMFVFSASFPSVSQLMSPFQQRKLHFLLIHTFLGIHTGDKEEFAPN